MSKIQRTIIIIALIVFIVTIIVVNLLIRNDVERMSVPVPNAEDTVTQSGAIEPSVAEPSKSHIEAQQQASGSDNSNRQPEEEISGPSDFPDYNKGEPLLQ